MTSPSPGSSTRELGDWPDRLAVVLRDCRHLREVVVLEHIDSTQDAARGLGCTFGLVVVAGHQTAGRGRFGRSWHGAAGEGVTLTLVIPAQPGPRMTAAITVSLAECLERHAQHPVRIKWPNDLLTSGRKLGGILIEQDDRVARVGIGINVAQERWPDDLADIAISLRQLGGTGDRLAVLESILPAVDAGLDRTDGELAAAYAERDALRGTTATFYVEQRPVTGRVLAVDPWRGLQVLVDGQPQWLAPAVTSTHPPTAPSR